VFNIQGSELIFLLLIALVVLGPEKLPDAVRKFGRTYAEFKKVANGFQGELRSVLDEPMREMRSTADALRNAAKFDFDAVSDDTGTSDETSADATDAAPTPSEPPAKRGTTLNFGNAAARAKQSQSESTAEEAAE
jgi:sec-independent protein translocase protein TatB